MGRNGSIFARGRYLSNPRAPGGLSACQLGDRTLLGTVGVESNMNTVENIIMPRWINRAAVAAQGAALAPPAPS